MFRILLLLGGLTACQQTPTHTPETCTFQFVQHVQQQHFKQAQKLATPHSQQALQTLAQQLTQQNPAAQRFFQAFQTIKLESVDCAYQNGRLYCRPCCTHHTNELIPFELIQHEGTWHIQLPPSILRQFAPKE